MSEFHFSRMFKRATGQSPSQYFIGPKRERARSLLKETSRALSESVSTSVTRAPAAFAHIFRRETGVLPQLTGSKLGHRLDRHTEAFQTLPPSFIFSATSEI